MVEDVHGLLRDLERRITALEAHPTLRPDAAQKEPMIRNMSKDGPKPDVPEEDNAKQAGVHGGRELYSD